MNEEDGEGQRWISYLEIDKKPIPSIDEFIVGGGFLEDSNRIDAASELIKTVHEVSHGGSLGWKNFWWKVSLSPAATSIYIF